MAALTSESGVPSSPPNTGAASSGAASSPKTPGAQTNTVACVNILQAVFTEEKGYTPHPVEGGVRAKRACTKIKSMVLKGKEWDVDLTAKTAYEVLRDALHVKVETHGWREHNHVVFAGQCLALGLEDERLGKYTAVDGNSAGLTQAQIREHRVLFYNGVFEFEKWIMKRAPRRLKKHSKEYDYRQDRWDYIASRCGFQRTNLPQPSEGFIVEEDGTIVINE